MKNIELVVLLVVYYSSLASNGLKAGKRVVSFSSDDTVLEESLGYRNALILKSVESASNKHETASESGIADEAIDVDVRLGDGDLLTRLKQGSSETPRLDKMVNLTKKQTNQDKINLEINARLTYFKRLPRKRLNRMVDKYVKKIAFAKKPLQSLVVRNQLMSLLKEYHTKLSK